MGADSLRISPRKGEETVLSGARTPFYPGYFAAVMATGILSTALHLYHQVALSDGLMAVAILAYLGLAYVYGRRAVRAPQNMWQDLKDPSRAFGFFTIVAGSNVLAVRVLLADWMGAAVVLGAVGLLVWAVLFYTIMTVLITGPAIDVTAVNGGWLIAIVAEQSIATLLASLVDALPQHAAALFLLSTTFWAMGLIFYVVFIGLIMNRLIFQRVGFGDLQPPYWINMGAAAITVLASSRLLSVHVQAPILLTLRPFLEGVTLMLWAWGSWWIPLLLILGVWKYWWGREPIRYHPSQWSIVFPLGMYATATTTMAHIHGFGLLHGIGAAFVWVALGAWLFVSSLGLWAAAQSTRPARTPPDGA